MLQCSSSCAGRAIFVAVPVALWLLFALIVHRPGFWPKFLALIAGNDNRLSLSRAQALAWSLVIFGSYAAAMAIHRPIRAASEEEVQHVDSLALQAQVRRRVAEDEYLRRANDTVAYAEDIATEQNDSAAAAATVNPNDPAAVDALKEAVAALQTARAKGASARDLANQARRRMVAARAEADSAEARAAELDWVRIPGTLLVLAGLAVGSGVLSSLIASGNGDTKTVCVTGVEPATHAQLITAGLGTATSPYLALVGLNFDKSGRLRFGKVPPGRRITFAVNDYAATPFWSDQLILTPMPPDPSRYNVIVVDSPNGKVAYDLRPAGAGFSLGLARTWYEAADLFRDDKSPDHFDIMKFQMFGWTIIALATYIGLLWTTLTPTLASLPVVDESIVILTGVSLAAYLGNKGVWSKK